MSNQSMSAAHQVAISHDPLEEHQSAGLAPLRRSGSSWPSGGMRPSPASLSLPALRPADFRPALLAGAIGLFAAWLVSGRPADRRHQTARGAQRRGGGYVTDREERRSPAPQPRFTAGPEGQSSREDFELDALNP